MKCAHIPGSLVYILSFYHPRRKNYNKRIKTYSYKCTYNAYLLNLIFVCIFKTALQYNSYNIGIAVY